MTPDLNPNDTVTFVIVVVCEAIVVVLFAWAITSAVLWLAHRHDQQRAELPIVKRVPMGRCEAGHEVPRDDLKWVNQDLGHRCSQHRVTLLQERLRRNLRQPDAHLGAIEE